MKRALFVFAWFVSLGLARSAIAADDGSAAKMYFEAGRQAYQAGMFGGAASAFLEAYKLSPQPPLLFSLAQAYRRQFDMDQDPDTLRLAVERLRQYVAEVQSGGRRADALRFLRELEPRIAAAEKKAARAEIPKERTQLMVSSRTPGATAVIDRGEPAPVPVLLEVTPGKHQVRVEAPGHFGGEAEELAVEGRLVVSELTLKEKPALLSLSAPEGAELMLDRTALGSAPFPGPIEVRSGEHFVAVTRAGHEPFTRTLSFARDQSLDLNVELDTTLQRRFAYGAFATASALVIAGTVASLLAVSSQSSASDLDSMIQGQLAGQQNVDRALIERYNDEIGARQDRRVAAGILFGSGAVMGLVGLVLYLFDNPHVEAPPLVRGPELDSGEL